ncbi:hypothetical protein BY996DRAFT_507623 [Phakopsora pachyrhizi]|nr:hypothetical protein BY996DRAFT_507623 [Phakopsora pachyrhizi]
MDLNSSSVVNSSTISSSMDDNKKVLFGNLGDGTQKKLGERFKDRLDVVHEIDGRTREDDDEKIVDITIIGAGMSGLSCGLELLNSRHRGEGADGKWQKRFRVQIVEARDRFGGRINSSRWSIEGDTGLVPPIDDDDNQKADRRFMNLKETDVGDNSGNSIRVATGVSDDKVVNEAQKAYQNFHSIDTGARVHLPET